MSLCQRKGEKQGGAQSFYIFCIYIHIIYIFYIFKSYKKNQLSHQRNKLLNILQKTVVFIVIISQNIIAFTANITSLKVLKVYWAPNHNITKFSFPRNNKLLNILKYETVIFNYNNISQYYCFYCSFDLIHVALANIRDLFQKHLKNLTDHKHLNSSVQLILSFMH